mgnify:CR=1 FL=1
MGDDALDNLRAFVHAELGPSLTDPQFDLDAWLDKWLRRRHPALGGRPAVELLHIPEGYESVKRVLGAMVSGAYL